MSGKLTRACRTAAVVSALAATSWTTASGAVSTHAAVVPVVTAGAVDVVASKGHSDVVKIPLTLSGTASRTVVVQWHVHVLTAVAGRDVATTSGSATFAAGQVLQWVPVTVLAAAPGAGAPCFFQTNVTCRTFSLALAVANGRATVSPSTDVNAILVPGVALAAGGASVGDLFVTAPRAGTSDHVTVPATLASPRSSPTVLTVSYHAVTAHAPQDYRVEVTRVTVPSGATVATLPLIVHGAGNSRAAAVLSVTIVASAGGVTRSSGVIVLQTPSGGVLPPSTAAGSQGTLTQDVNHTTNTGDTYAVTGTATAPTFTADASNIGGNSRVVFWPTGEVPGVATQVCATWSGQSPAQSNGILTQQGVALNVATQNGVVRAVTVTKNVWGFDNTIFNVHVWDSTQPTPFTLLGDAHLSGSLTSGLPWDICARVAGPSVQFIVWPQNSSPPVWGSTSQGGAVALPTSWGPGVAGFYVGHLAPGNSASMQNLTVGVTGMNFDGHVL